MTLTELQYIVALARSHHFGKAAQACQVSQPTLSLAIQKLETALGVLIFERQSTPIHLTPVGQEIVAQAQVVLSEAAAIGEIARRGKDPLQGPLRLGLIYTIAPYLLPSLVRHISTHTPQMPLVLQENLSSRLLEMLQAHEIDCALLAEPFAGTERFARAPLYDEPFWAAVPKDHPLAQKTSVTAEDLKNETLLLLGQGHCFRDHVLSLCPEFSDLSQQSPGLRFKPNLGLVAGTGFNTRFEGSSLSTLQHMVAAGLGVTVVPCSSLPPPVYHRSTPSTPSEMAGVAGVKYLPIDPPAPSRRVVLLWRHGFYRHEAMAALRRAIDQCNLPGVIRPPLSSALSNPP